MSYQGHKNIYVCEACRGHIVTVDTDDGTTPFLTPCCVTKGCKGMMKSSFYRVFDQSIGPSHEWFRPSPQARFSPSGMEHVKRGGLILRKLDEPRGMVEIRSERARQVSVEGWSRDHDDKHPRGQLLDAAKAYLEHARGRAAYRDDGIPKGWPWEDRWWKPTEKRRDLVKAGALALAEAEREERIYGWEASHALNIARIAGEEIDRIDMGDGL